MTPHIIRRMLLLVPTLLGISLLAFVLLRVVPGDPLQVMQGEHATPEQVARYRATNGLDESLPIQYARYLSNLVRGDWGTSVTTNLPVTTELGQRLPASIELGLAALLLACLIGIPMGGLAAWCHDSALDIFVSTGSLLGVSVPLFLIGLLLSDLLGYHLGWLPPSGRLTIGIELQPLAAVYPPFLFRSGPLAPFLQSLSDVVANLYLPDSLLTGNWSALADAARHLILPALTLSMAPLAVITRMTRACLLVVFENDYIRTARAKGLRARQILFVHALRNAAPPVVTVIGLQLGLLLSGAILTETIFSWPGMGQLVVERVLARDYPVIQGFVVAIALLFACINLLTDLFHVSVDPQVRYD